MQYKCYFIALNLILFDEIIATYFGIFFLQIDWLNTYHKKVQDTIGPLLINTNREAYDWMELRTRKITYAVSAAPKEILSRLIILLSFTLVFVS